MFLRHYIKLKNVFIISTLIFIICFFVWEDVNIKAIVFIFFTTWCPPCLVQMNYLSQFYLNYQDDFKIVGILMEDKTKEQIDEFVAKNNIQFKIAYGENNFYFANAVGYIDSMPYILILNADGKLIQYYSGLIPPEMLESDIKRALL